MSSYVFKFIAGKYEGGEFKLPSDGEVLIGRSIEVPICLVEDMVSRRHARLTIAGHDLTIQDLGSTNGTFVNGERVEKSKLAAGDRVLVGTSIMRLEQLQQTGAAEHKPLPRAVTLADEMTLPNSDAPKRALESVQAQAGEQRLSGTLREMKIGEVISLIAQSRRTGTLEFTLPWGTATLGFDAGALCHAAASAPYDKLSPLKILTRLVAEESRASGSFAFVGGEAPAPIPALKERSCEAWLLEAARVYDEVVRQAERLGTTLDAPVRIASQRGKKLSELTPARLDVLQLALECNNLQSLLDAHDSADDEVLGHLAALISEGYLTLA